MIRIRLSARQKKYVLAGTIALFGALADVSMQLINAGGANVTRSVAIGLFLGAIARIGGAVLAAITTTES